MLHNASGFKSVPIDDLANTRCEIVQPAHIAFECSPQDGDLDRRPNGSENIERRLRSILGPWIVVLKELNIITDTSGIFGSDTPGDEMTYDVS